MPTHATPTPGPCPTDADLAALGEARLDAPARERLLRHIDACDACRRIVAALGRAEASTRRAPLCDCASDDPDEAASDPSPGTIVGRFELLHVLGAGGMGIVYEAHDPELDRRVALKLMRSSVHASAVEARARQLREARALARFSHPHVVGVFDVGLFEGRVWIAMELVVGQTLKEWALARRPTWDEAFAVLLDAARGLAAVHAAGLVHRDFKPSNVLIDETGRVRVADFGLVSSGVDAELPSLESGRVALDPSGTPTPTAAIVGTPAYMAPEQHRGKPIDARADQFAFCVTAYEILYGRRPFDASTTSAMLASMRTGEVARPSRTDVPRRVHRVLVRGLAWAPADRWPSMDALVEAAARAARGRRAATWMLLGAAATTAGVLAAEGDAPAACVDAGAAMTEAWYAAREDVQQAFARADLLPAYAPVEAALDRHAADWVRASRHACTEVLDPQQRELVDACLDDRRAALAALVGVLARGATRTLARGLEATRSLPAVDACIDPTRAPDVAPRIHDPATEDARAKLASATAHLWAGDADGARELAVAVLDDAEAMSDPRLVAAALHARGTADRHRGRGDDAEATLTEAFLAARAAGEEELALRTGLELATLVGDEQGRTDDGLQWIEHALQASPVELRERPRWAALAEDCRGLVIRRKGDLPAALRHLTAAVSIAENSDDILPLNRAYYLSHAGTTHAMLGQTEAGRVLLEEALAIIDEHAGPDHPQLGLERMNLGSVLFAESRYAEARETWTEALQILERVHLEGDPLLAQLRANLGLAARADGDFDAALEALTRARDDMRAHFGSEHPIVAKVHGQLAELHVARNELDDAVIAANAAIASLESSGGDDDALGRSWMHLGAAKWIGGDAQAAADAFGRGVALLQRRFGDRHGAVASAHVRWCEALLDDDPRGEAPARCAEALEVARTAGDPEAEHRARRGQARLALLRGEAPSLAEPEASSAAPDPVAAYARLRWAEALRDAGRAEHGRREATAAARAFEALGPPWEAMRHRATTAAR